MTPTQCGTGIAVTHAYHLLHGELVVTVVERKEKAVVLAKRLRYLSIHIIEVNL